MRSHQEQQEDYPEPIVSMDFQKNPSQNHHHLVLPSPSSSSQDFNSNHHQHNIHISKRNHEQDEGFIFKKPKSLSCSSLVAGEGYVHPPPPPPQAQDFKKSHHQHKIHVSNKTNENEVFSIKKPKSLSCSSLAAGGGDMMKPPSEAIVVEESGRERLKRHRVEMSGRVWIPDIWGHEDLLKEWIDCTVFDSSLGNKNIVSARAALIQEGRSTVRIENKC